MGLLKVSATRMAGCWCAFHRALHLKQALCRTVESPIFKKMKMKGSKVACQKLKDTVLDLVECDDFWDAIKVIVKSFFPIIKCLRMCDADTPNLDKVHHYTKHTTAALDDIKTEFDDKSLFNDHALNVVLREFLDDGPSVMEQPTEKEAAKAVKKVLSKKHAKLQRILRLI